MERIIPECNEDRRFVLEKKAGRCIIRFDEGHEEPVKVVWARPLSGIGKDVAFVNKKKKTLAMVKSLDALDEHSRAVAGEALAMRYILPRIVCVKRTRSHFGVVFWDVVTDNGPKQFAMRGTHKNVFYVTEDHLILRDVIGNVYEIESLEAIDKASKGWIEAVV